MAIWFACSALLVAGGVPIAPRPADQVSHDVSYLDGMEHHLKSKAADVVERFTNENYTIDLSLELATAQTTTTTYIPGEKVLVATQEKKESSASKMEQLAEGAMRPVIVDGAVLKDAKTMQPVMEPVPAEDDGAYSNIVRSQKWELTGTWEESTDVRPQVKSLRCCVTLAPGENIDHDQLYRCLSYALGINLARGDTLQIVEL